MSVKLRQELERRIVRAIAKEAIRLGYTVSVFDGEEWTTSKSAKLADIMGAIMTTDEDALRIYDSEGRWIGDVQLVYGNDGYDVISDHTVGDEMDALLTPANKLADHYAPLGY